MATATVAVVDDADQHREGCGPTWPVPTPTTVPVSSATSSRTFAVTR